MGREIGDEKNGHVQVYDDSVVEELLLKGDVTSTTRPSSASSMPMGPTLANGNFIRKKARPVRAMSTPAFGRTTTYGTYSIKKTTRGAWLDRPTIEAVRAKADVESKDARDMCMTVLNNEKLLSNEMNNLLNHTDTCKLRKKEMLHKKWTDRVYEPVLKDVVSLMESPAYTNLILHKNHQYEEYLEHLNRKGHAFLDTFTLDEYYPLALQSASLVAETKGIQDPLLAPDNTRFQEERMVIQCIAGAKLTKEDMKTVREMALPPLPLSRKEICSNDWLSIPLGCIGSPLRMASRLRMKTSRNSSQIGFEKWATPRQSAGGESPATRKTPAWAITGTTSQVPRMHTGDSARPMTGEDITSMKEYMQPNAYTTVPVQTKGTQTICVS